MTEVPYVPYPLESPSRYAHGPDSFPQPGVPRGTLHEHEWNDSRVFPGTRRRYWVYVPAQYREAEPASLMVFQDADWYLNPNMNDRAQVVFDNLIDQGAMPVTIGVFVAPGEPGQRNAEYDAFSDAYTRFLLDELLPAVQADYAITDDPEQWAIGGGSSGGLCAFTAGWMRPDRFRRVLCLVPGFPQLEGGNRYPQLIRETPAKPLRVFLQTVSRDIRWNSPRHNHFSETLKVAAALTERGYDFRLVVGEGAHDGNHSGVTLPDALRWLWRPITSPSPAGRVEPAGLDRDASDDQRSTLAATNVTATSASAREAHARGELAAWSQAFLRGEGGNLGIANPLLERHDDVYVLAEVGLRDVYPIVGIEEDFDHPVPHDEYDEYERKTEAMMQMFEQGWDAPPLFVHMHTLRLVDGNTRREALLRLGRQSYWAVMWLRRPPPNGRGQPVSLDE